MLPDKLRAKLTETLAKLPEIEAQLADPAVLGDPSALQRLGKQHAELTELRDLYTLATSRRRRSCARRNRFWRRTKTPTSSRWHRRSAKPLRRASKSTDAR
jgi:protein subunit release factor A